MKIPKRSSAGKFRGPLILCSDAAEEFGVPIRSLQLRLHHREGPKPASLSRSATYYEPRELRKWWCESGSLSKAAYKAKLAASQPQA